MSNANIRHFYCGSYAPNDGYLLPPVGPGFGYELDESKIRSRVELSSHSTRDVRIG
jgi:hypothetical protein